jgi:hypothetical protein
LIDGSPISAVAWGIEEVDCLLVAGLLALARRRLVVFDGGDEDIWEGEEGFKQAKSLSKAAETQKK